MIKKLSLLLLAAGMVACSSSDEVDIEPMDLVDFEETVKLKELWSQDIGSGQDERYSRLTPTIDGDSIFAATAEGDVVRLARDSGKEQWAVDLDVTLSGGVGVGPNQVFVGGYSGHVYALSKDNGERLWQANVSSEVLSAPISNGEVVVVQSLDGRLYGFNAADGSPKWRYDNPVPVLTMRGNASPVLLGDTLYAGFASGKVVALRIDDGVQVWEQRVAIPQGKTELERVVDVDASPLMVGDILYLSSLNGRLMAVTRSNGRPLWAISSSSHNDISERNGLVFVSGSDDRLRAYRAGDGNEVWANETMLRRHLGAPQAFSSYVAVTDYEGYLHLLDREGNFVAREKVDGDGVRASMISDGETLYVYGNSGELIAYRAQ
ncbi:MAG: outer membrane protein assembly factor BamB [Cellvibrionaceae bacterium]|nr:outer membrane protein assembly factor BamB [Cellvibrionaceae bacterium]MCV6626476.1 outer membrane protein assembly factor BamB [Cellvibrionaceae bacterium]